MLVIGTSCLVSFPIYTGPQSLLIAAMLRILESSGEAIAEDATSQQNTSQRGQYHGWKLPCSKAAGRFAQDAIWFAPQLPTAIVEVEAVAERTGGLLGYRTLFAHGGKVTVKNSKAVWPVVRSSALYIHVYTVTCGHGLGEMLEKDRRYSSRWSKRLTAGC